MGAESIDRLFQPRAVAVFGASDDLGKYGGRVMHYLALHGYAGDIVPINSRRATVAGRTCYASIGQAPKVDVAVIALPAQAVPQTLRECAQAGVSACVVISAGFAEAGEAGAALQNEIVSITRQTAMRIVGPNCMGLMNLRNGMALTAAKVFDAKPLHVAPIGLVSQSGAVMLSVFNRAQDQGIGFSQIVSVGNQSDLETCDFLEYMVTDPYTQVICLHIEGLRDGRRLRELLVRANRAGKPVVILKTGRSELGSEVAKSHTASLAGGYGVFAAACREAGAVLVDDPDVLVLVAHMLQRYGPAKGRGIGMLSPSGGFNGIVVDRMSDHGLGLAKFNAATRAALQSVFPTDHLRNPLDLGLIQNVAALEGTAEAARLASADPDVGLTFVPLTTSPDYERTVHALAATLMASGKPALFVVTPGSVANGARKVIRDHGIPYCDRIDDAIRLLDAYFGYQPLPAATRAVEACEVVDFPFPDAGYLDEPKTKALLSAAGVRITREMIVSSADEAVAAAQAIGFPVVLKGVSDRIVHKSDAGLVRLGLKDAAAASSAYGAVREILNRLDPAAKDCIVAEMARGELEMIVGVMNDPVFGAAVLVGAGGVLVDLFDDVQVALAPVSEATARAMVLRLRIAPLLAGYRGKPPLDLQAVVDTIVKVSRLADASGGRLQELDINPLLVCAQGRGAIALDARSSFDQPNRRED